MTTREPSSPNQRGRGTFQLVLDPLVGRYFAARLFSTAGVWIHNIVAAILAFQLSGSALMVGMVSVAQFGPQVLLAPLSGSLADRGNRRGQLIVGRLIVALGSGFLALWLTIADVDGLPGVWPVITAAFVVGLGFVLTVPAQESIIPALVPKQDLPAAIALNAVPSTLARTMGPALGAFIADSIGPSIAFAITAATNLLFALVVSSLDIESRPQAPASTDYRFRASMRLLRENPALTLMLGGIVAVGIGTDPAITLTPPLGEMFGEGNRNVALLASAFGVGSLGAFSVLGRLRQRIGLKKLATTGLGLLAAGLLAVGSVRSIDVAMTGFGIAGVGMTMGFTSFTALLQQRLPDQFRGRVMALWAVAFIGSRPIAAATNGTIADHFGTRAAFATVAFTVAALAWISRPAALRGLSQQSPPTET